MEKDLLAKARNLEDRIDDLRKSLDRLRIYAMPSSSLKIEVNQYYGDMGRSFTNKVEFRGDVADRLFNLIVESLKCQVTLLERELKEL
ncbi:MAG: hypothetical protein IJM41_00705 [Bacteroidales bacterium]|nr:hypothetical protein [Bacteroidales bacterium]